jgi:hypothetical protein
MPMDIRSIVTVCMVGAKVAYQVRMNKVGKKRLNVGLEWFAAHDVLPMGPTCVGILIVMSVI